MQAWHRPVEVQKAPLPHPPHVLQMEDWSLQLLPELPLEPELEELVHA